MMTEHPGVAAGLDSWLCCQCVPAPALREGSSQAKAASVALGGGGSGGCALVLLCQPWWMTADMGDSLP